MQVPALVDVGPVVRARLLDREDAAERRGLMRYRSPRLRSFIDFIVERFGEGAA